MKMTPHRFIERLQRRGFQLLGAGAFSSVLGKPGSNRVIKVGRSPPEGWIDYVMWADAAGYAGSFAPKVYSIKVHEDTFIGPRQMWEQADQSWYVAVMERLDCTLSNDRRETGRDVTRKVMREMSNIINGGFGGQPDRAALHTHCPGAEAFADALRASQLSMGWDLHDGNWMLRGDAIVLTDPISAPSKSGTTRWRSSGVTHPHLAAVNAALEAIARRAAAH